MNAGNSPSNWMRNRGTVTDPLDQAGSLINLMLGWGGGSPLMHRSRKRPTEGEGSEHSPKAQTVINLCHAR